VEVTGRVCTNRQTAKHLKNELVKKSTELNMSEADPSLAVLEFDRDLDLNDLPSSLNCLSSLDELVDILGIRPVSFDQYKYTDASEPPYRNTFKTEDRWPI